MLEILIKNVLVIDGGGGPGYPGQVGIAGDRIALVSAASCGATAVEISDGDGLVCTPGFIDIHSHADVTMGNYPQLDNALQQGVTTVVTGNAGLQRSRAERRLQRAILAPSCILRRWR